MEAILDTCKEIGLEVNMPHDQNGIQS